MASGHYDKLKINKKYNNIKVNNITNYNNIRVNNVTNYNQNNMSPNIKIINKIINDKIKGNNE